MLQITFVIGNNRYRYKQLFIKSYPYCTCWQDIKILSGVWALPVHNSVGLQLSCNNSCAKKGGSSCQYNRMKRVIMSHSFSDQVIHFLVLLSAFFGHFKCTGILIFSSIVWGNEHVVQCHWPRHRFWHPLFYMHFSVLKLPGLNCGSHAYQKQGLILKYDHSRIKWKDGTKSFKRHMLTT